MQTAQLPLIEELSLGPIKDFTSSRPKGKFVAPSNLLQVLVLLALLSGPQPLKKLQRILGIHDSATLLADFCKFGVELLCNDVPILDADGNIGSSTVCMLTAADARRINRWLKMTQQMAQQSESALSNGRPSSLAMGQALLGIVEPVEQAEMIASTAVSAASSEQGKQYPIEVTAREADIEEAD